MRVAAVVADLDGTLVRPDGSVSPATLSALAGLRAARIPVVIATARTPIGVQALAALAGLFQLAVCCSGAIGWSAGSRAVVWRRPLTSAAVQRGAELADSVGAGLAGFDGTMWRIADREGHLKGWTPDGLHERTSSISDIVAAPCCNSRHRTSRAHVVGARSPPERRSQRGSQPR